jgi:hypothetical protein
MNLAARRSLDARRIQKWSRGRRREHVVEDGRWKKMSKIDGKKRRGIMRYEKRNV